MSVARHVTLVLTPGNDEGRNPKILSPADPWVRTVANANHFEQVWIGSVGYLTLEHVENAVTDPRAWRCGGVGGAVIASAGSACGNDSGGATHAGDAAGSGRARLAETERLERSA